MSDSESPALILKGAFYIVLPPMSGEVRVGAGFSSESSFECKSTYLLVIILLFLLLLFFPTSISINATPYTHTRSISTPNPTTHTISTPNLTTHPFLILASRRLFSCVRETQRLLLLRSSRACMQLRVGCLKVVASVSNNEHDVGLCCTGMPHILTIHSRVSPLGDLLVWSQ